MEDEIPEGFVRIGCLSCDATKLFKKVGDIYRTLPGDEVRGTWIDKKGWVCWTCRPFTGAVEAGRGDPE